jgi:hypothetical protein
LAIYALSKNMDLIICILIEEIVLILIALSSVKKVPPMILFTTINSIK